jgi:hypothetical protein
MTEPRTFVIGDSHGHLDRLEALLLQENILVDCGVCDATGDNENLDPCEFCDGVGVVRNYEDGVRVVHIGDLMHGGYDTSYGDQECYRYAYKFHWIDDLVWGNHERGLVDERHAFGGMAKRLAGPTIQLMNAMERDGRTYFATTAHGFLLTHAGLGAYWDGHELVMDSPEVAASALNELANDPDHSYGVIHAVSYRRGGSGDAGGILWRDDNEPISGKFNQVYGHTADRDGLHRTHETNGKIAYKIDIGGKSERRLGGLWLPDQTLVKVELGL